jgi:hypothetical protein
VALSGAGWYDELPPEPGLYGGRTDGAAGSVGRLTDTLSYFTIWANVVVAVSVTTLLTRSRSGSPTQRVLRLSGLLMITVTAIVYHLLLAPTVVVTGWSRLTDPILHVATPVLTLLVWVVWGPRGWVSTQIALLALVVPLIWIGWMLGRGAVIDAYPYDFTNAAELGYASVAVTLTLIVVFGSVVAVAYWGLDVLLARRRR